MFDKTKKQVLAKLDKSKKRSIDKEISHILDVLNVHPDFYTTSSCSGRIMLFEPHQKKNQANWLYVTHGLPKLNQMKKAVANSTKDVWFKQEPAIFHVVCRNLDAAKIILDAANTAGMKRTGLSTINNKIVCQVSSTDQLTTIVAKDDNVLVDDTYLLALIKEANKKMAKNKERLDLFIAELMQRLSSL